MKLYHLCTLLLLCFAHAAYSCEVPKNIPLPATRINFGNQQIFWLSEATAKKFNVFNATIETFKPLLLTPTEESLSPIMLDIHQELCKENELKPRHFLQLLAYATKNPAQRPITQEDIKKVAFLANYLDANEEILTTSEKYQSLIDINFADTQDFYLEPNTAKVFKKWKHEIGQNNNVYLPISHEFCNDNQVYPKHFSQLLIYIQEGLIPNTLKDLEKTILLSHFLNTESKIHQKLVDDVCHKTNLEAVTYNAMYSPESSPCWHNVVQAPAEQKLSAIQLWKRDDPHKRLFDAMMANTLSIATYKENIHELYSGNTRLRVEENLTSIHDFDLLYIQPNADLKKLNKRMRFLTLPLIRTVHLPLLDQLRSLTKNKYSHISFYSHKNKSSTKDLNAIDLETFDISCLSFYNSTIRQLPILTKSSLHYDLRFENCVLPSEFMQSLETISCKKFEEKEEETKRIVFTIDDSHICLSTASTTKKILVFGGMTALTLAGYHYGIYPYIAHYFNTQCASHTCDMLKTHASPILLPSLQFLLNNTEKFGLSFSPSCINAIQHIIPQAKTDNLTLHSETLLNAQDILKKIDTLDTKFFNIKKMFNTNMFATLGIMATCGLYALKEVAKPSSYYTVTIDTPIEESDLQ